MLNGTFVTYLFGEKYTLNVRKDMEEARVMPNL